MFTLDENLSIFTTDLRPVRYLEGTSWCVPTQGTTQIGRMTMHDRRLEGTAHAAGSTPSQGASPNGHKDLSRAGQAARLAREWATNPRWRGINRTYSAEDVIRLRGSVQE